MAVAREAANAAAAQNAAKANAARDAAKAAAAREAVAEDSLSVPSSLLAKRSIFYPSDTDAVPEQDKRTVQAHAKYLAEHANRSVRLEGHADERGSSEYNLALGQRRAEGVKKMLLVGGVKEGQIESISYGEEKPMSTAHNEAAWSQNRRTDLNYNVK
ncbi:Peptidoglycan-associated protein [Candidatus Nitrotoga sp. 1052]|nr:Peptidoglycan-associated protein [Candidatus Nitrotoga sp. 1052]